MTSNENIFYVVQTVLEGDTRMSYWVENRLAPPGTDRRASDVTKNGQRARQWRDHLNKWWNLTPVNERPSLTPPKL